MKNFNLAILFSLVAITTQLLSAQQVYEARHYASPSDIYLYNRFTAGFSNEDIIASGADVTWDLSSQTDLNTHVNLD